MKIKTRHGRIVDLTTLQRQLEAYDRQSLDMSGIPRHDTELSLLDIINAILQLPRWQYVDFDGMMPFPGQDNGGGDYIDRNNIIALLEHGIEKLAEFQQDQEATKRILNL